MWTRLLILLLAIGFGAARAQTAPAPPADEPAYTARFADKKMARMTVEVTADAQNEKRVRIVSRNTLDAVLMLDAVMSLDSTNQPLKVRVRFGEKPVENEPEPATTELVGERSLLGSWGVYEPARKGTIPYVGKAVVGTFSLLFFGRVYDFARGGTQTATFLNFRGRAPRPFTATLEAQGKEKITLDDGKTSVLATKIAYKAPEATFLPRGDRAGTLYIGPKGELLACPTRLLGQPLLMSTPAVVDADGSVSLTLANGRLRLVASPTADGWEAKLTAKDANRVLARGKLAKSGLVRETEAGMGVRYATVITPTEIRWSADAGPTTDVAVTDGKIFLLPFWFVTDIWETGIFFVRLNEEQTGTFLPLFDGDRAGRLFTLKRLANGARLDDGKTVRHYRLTSGKNLAELYTDGTRLLFYVDNESNTITRDGWEEWASKLPPLSKAADDAARPGTARTGTRPRRPN